MTEKERLVLALIEKVYQMDYDALVVLEKKIDDMILQNSLRGQNK